MAAGWLSKPGSVRGPCIECAHRDCTAARETALSRCPYCNEQIGYETAFYDHATEGVNAGRIMAGQREYAHALCFELALEENRVL